MKNFKDKVAVVTGAASGIGLGLAERCAEEGMKVVLADVEEAPLFTAEKALKDKGADVLAVKTDVSRLEDIEALAQKTLDTFGGVHLLFNNAGVQSGESANVPIWDTSLADWQWVLGVNLWGVVYGINVFTPIMLKQDTECHIVNTASMAGLITEPHLVIYAVTKSSIIKLSEGLYLQLKQRNSSVGVSVLCPAFVSSNFNNAERNRPAELRNPPQPAQKYEQPPLLEYIQKGGITMLSPQQCADIVFKAIRKDEFYILTDTLIYRLAKQRMDNILQRQNPEIPVII
jgi:NAD(P)-dependent dehydrogenase (short-subunit alcohol dehydrogenase family)